MDDYKEASREYQEALADFAHTMKFLRSFGEATRYQVSDFLIANFGMQSLRGHGRGAFAESVVEMDRWPARDDLMRQCKRVADAYNALHAAYSGLSSGDREVAKMPPSSVDLPRK